MVFGLHILKHLIFIVFLYSVTFAQNEPNVADIKHIYNGNQELIAHNFVDAEAEYRKAISENPAKIVLFFAV